MSSIIETRTTGSSGTSIGTHLLLENLFLKYIKPYDEDREIIPVDIEKYEYHIYNLYTIVRNIINSVTSTKEKESILLEQDFLNVLKLELANIAKYYKKVLTKPVIFYPDYTEIYQKYNVNKVTGDTAPYRLHTMITNKLKQIEKKEKIVSINNGKGYKLPKLNGKLLITTHIALDLHNNNSKLDLLESHTGALVTKKNFYKKYHQVGKEDLTLLPFIEDLHYILGDKTLVVPMDIATRREVLAIAKKFNWNPLTTRDKVKDNISRSKDIGTILKDFQQQYKM